MEYLRLTLLCISIAGAFIIIIPIFILPSTYWDSSSSFLSPVHPFKEVLQGSSLLLHAHILILGSTLSLAIEFCLDFFSGNSETISIAQIRERAAVLASYGAVTITFLSCRNLDSIPAIYVGVNCARTCFASGMIYYAVYPELQSKLDRFTLHSFSSTVVLWEIVNIIEALQFYFNTYNSANQWMGFLSLLVLFYCVISWLRSIARRQNSWCIKLSDLTTDEYAAMSYIVPLFIQPIFSFTYCVVASGSASWLLRSGTTLTVQLGSLYVLLLIVILVPGRILHMLAVANMALLRLKQIFVRYVSHEIRSPLNIVHAGLDLLMLTIKAADPTAPFITIDRSTADFVFQMFFASESAINILNDLLLYEHIESGTFTLSLTAVCVAGSLQNKLGWATMLASQKSIIFSVIDSTLASEFGLADSVAVIDGDEESGGVLLAGSTLAAQRDAFLNVDIHRLDQVIRNLITNAVKFTPTNGRVDLTISCTLLEKGNSSTIKDKFGSDAVGMFRVAVTDSGVGLSQDEQKNIFGEFTQFNKNNLQSGGGSGLGLWISRRIIQMHKGFMGVTSEGQGRGSTFFFELPLFGPGQLDSAPTNSQPLQEPSHSMEGSRYIHFDRVADLEKEDESDSGGGGSGDDADAVLAPPTPAAKPRNEDDVDAPAKISGSLCFLIVDDSSINVKVMTRLLESEKEGVFANAVILTADDGTTAIETLQQQTSAGRQVHFVLMDSIMTKLNGPEAAWIMRDEMGFCGPIIGVTGNALSSDIETFISKGADEVIIKPLTKAKLMTVLEKYVSAAGVRCDDKWGDYSNRSKQNTSKRSSYYGVLPVTCNESSGPDIK